MCRVHSVILLASYFCNCLNRNCWCFSIGMSITWWSSWPDHTRKLYFGSSNGIVFSKGHISVILTASKTEMNFKSEATIYYLFSVRLYAFLCLSEMMFCIADLHWCSAKSDSLPALCCCFLFPSFHHSSKCANCHEMQQ